MDEALRDQLSTRTSELELNERQTEVRLEWFVLLLLLLLFSYCFSSTIDTFIPFAATAAITIEKEPRQQHHEPTSPATSYYSSSLSTMASHAQPFSALNLPVPARASTTKAPSPIQAASSSSSLGAGIRYRPSSKPAVTSFSARAAQHGPQQRTLQSRAQVVTASKRHHHRKDPAAPHVSKDSRRKACSVAAAQARDKFRLQAVAAASSAGGTHDSEVSKDVADTTSSIPSRENSKVGVDKDGNPQGGARVVAYNPAKHREGAAMTLARAFRNDPIFRYLLPSDQHYDRVAPTLMKLGLWTFYNESNNLIDVCEMPAEDGKEMSRADEKVVVAGVAVWEPPKFTVGQILRAIAMFLWMALALGLGKAPRNFNIVRSFYAKQEEYAKGASHLLAITTAPVFQGQGLGSKLLRHGTARAEKQGASSYLESSSLGSRRLYERNGFEPLEEIYCDEGKGPMVTIMLRK